ncbi:MAG: hypothetical protein DMG21_07520 [Acidobacteria bacterium]|nr:MAG: hypothetical protein DMG21_07520 [Acidobacteriota bacterium]
MTGRERIEKSREIPFHTGPSSPEKDRFRTSTVSFLPAVAGFLYFQPNGFTRPPQALRLLAAFETGKVQYLMWQTKLEHPRVTDQDDPLGPVRAYIRDEYQPVVRFPLAGDQILERR